MWILLSVVSALCLGCYDVAKKQSLNRFPVIFVLTLSVCISSVLLLVPLLLSRLWPDLLIGTILYVPHVSLYAHTMIFLKSCLVLSSWICAYIALKHLPLSTVAPMQATRPMWTLFGAMLIFGERLNMHQWVGVGLALGSMFAFSLFQVRKTDGLKAKGEGWYYLLLAAGILLGSCSGLYDKYMMRHFDHNAVQVYYTFYQALLMLLVFFIAHHRQPSPTIAHHRQLWPILAISIFLVLSDFTYLLALSHQDSLIAIVATIRRGGIIIPFLYGILVLHEPGAWRKAICTAGILAGLVFLIIN